MQKIIGLDIGSYSIKAVEIINSINSYEIVNFYEKIIPVDESRNREEILPECMEAFFRENEIIADRIVTAMPGQFISSRILPFNFSDPRKIANTIMYVLEDAVPFNLEDMVVDHQILGNQSDKTMTLAVMTRKNFLSSFLGYLSMINIDPKLIDVDSLAFYNIASHVDSGENQVFGLVDIGHEKTSVCLVEGETLRMFRTINLGGKYITEFLARDLELSFKEAEQVKHSIGAVSWDENKQNVELKSKEHETAKRVGIAANGFAKELTRTLYAFKIWDKQPLSKIYLSGGTSRLEGIENYLQDQLGIPVVKNDLMSTNLSIDSNLQGYREILPQSVAIGLRAVTGAKRHSTINLRKGEFAYSQDYETLLRGCNIFFKWVSAGIGVLIFSYILQYILYTNQTSKIQKKFIDEYAKIDKSQVVKIKKMKNFANIRKYAINNLQHSVNDNQFAIDQFSKATSGSGALLALRDISKAIPPDVKVDVTLFDYQENPDLSGKIVLKGETDGYGLVSKIKESISQIQQIENVSEKSGSKPGSSGKVIEFTLDAEYLPEFLFKGGRANGK